MQIYQGCYVYIYGIDVMTFQPSNNVFESGMYFWVTDFLFSEAVAFCFGYMPVWISCWNVYVAKCPLKCFRNFFTVFWLLLPLLREIAVWVQLRLNPKSYIEKTMSMKLFMHKSASDFRHVQASSPKTISSFFSFFEGHCNVAQYRKKENWLADAPRQSL